MAASKKITGKKQAFTTTDRSKYITVSDFSGNGKKNKFGYSNSYIPKTPENLDKIGKLKGRPIGMGIV